ncbi:MAG TPA: hypothetical protein VLX32_11950 [Candidatus Acidoferrum sp.]|nr:hypothetical protein [Candidatus Acidoferrum sp.]
MRKLVILDAASFCRARPVAVLILSLLVLIPCFWHRQIEAGDLASHTYNAWLAQLIARGQAPGLYVVHQSNNVLFDLALFHLGNLIGLHAAEKTLISIGALIFFWGVFSFLAIISRQPPWFLTPCIAMLTYGYSFSMGFINYWLSLGLACCVLAVLWRGGIANWFCAAPLAALAFMAHPIGFLWMAGTLVYVFFWRIVPKHWRLPLPILAVVFLFGIHLFVLHHPAFSASWPDMPFYLRNGSDQLILFGHRYALLSYGALAWGILCFAVDAARRLQGREVGSHSYRLPLELYALAFCATTLLPENLHSGLYAGWIGLIVSRLTAISAILGLAVLNCARPRKWIFAGFLVCATAFFAFLYQDTGTLNRVEANAQLVAASLPFGTRVIPFVNPPDDWRIEFIFHVVERACVGHCFSYSNYEPASGQFRIRVHPGSSIVTAYSDAAEAMASGDYVIQDSDPPLTAIYQCDDNDFARLCAAPLHPGDSTETPTLDSGAN